MPSLRVINESGEVETVDVTTGGVAFETDDGGVFQPAIVERVEFDHEGIMSQITWKNCNRVSNRREADQKPDIVIEGVVTEDQLETLKELDRHSDLRLVSDIHDGPVVVRRTTVEQTADLVEFIPESGEPSLAFGFQLQVRVSQHHDSVTTVPMENTVFAVADDVLDE